MLSQKDIDKLQMNIQNGQPAYVYYVAHAVETRESSQDESEYKIMPKFKVLKLQITEISNAYFEYLYYLGHKDEYQITEEVQYYDLFTKHVNYYTEQADQRTYLKYMNPKMPSMIYGVKRKILDYDGQVLQEYNDPSPIKVVYTNVLECGDLGTEAVKDLYNAGKLNWKYKYLSDGEIVDGIVYKFLTSDWYVLKIDKFYKMEYPMINVKEKNAYFTDIVDAFSFVSECQA